MMSHMTRMIFMPCWLLLMPCLTSTSLIDLFYCLKGWARHHSQAWALPGELSSMIFSQLKFTHFNSTMQDVTDQVQVHLDVAAAVENQHSRNILLKRKLLIAKKIPLVCDIIKIVSWNLFILWCYWFNFSSLREHLVWDLDQSKTPYLAGVCLNKILGHPFNVLLRSSVSSKSASRPTSILNFLLFASRAMSLALTFVIISESKSC